MTLPQFTSCRSYEKLQWHVFYPTLTFLQECLSRFLKENVLSYLWTGASQQLSPHKEVPSSPFKSEYRVVPVFPSPVSLTNWRDNFMQLFHYNFILICSVLLPSFLIPPWRKVAGRWCPSPPLQYWLTLLFQCGQFSLHGWKLWAPK